MFININESHKMSVKKVLAKWVCLLCDNTTMKVNSCTQVFWLQQYIYFIKCPSNNKIQLNSCMCHVSTMENKMVTESIQLKTK